MSRMTSVLAAVTVLALAAACAGSGVASYRGVPEMNGVRTADAGRQLVVTYIGGGCDEQAKTRVIETATLVTVTAAIPTTGGNCTSVGIARELTFRLQRPLGDRHFRNGLRGGRSPSSTGRSCGRRGGSRRERNRHHQAGPFRTRGLDPMDRSHRSRRP
jgi:hypothetical protein